MRARTVMWVPQALKAMQVLLVCRAMQARTAMWVPQALKAYMATQARTATWVPQVQRALKGPEEQLR